jgi:hypothetical protein
MAEKARLSAEALTRLCPEKLAELVLDAANRDAGIRRRVSAALAAEKGPDAVAAVIDRRLTALARARGFIEWEDARAFAADLSSTVSTIVEELGKIDPDAAIDRLIRFLSTAESVFDRIDDSSGHIQGIYYDAADAVAGLVAALTLKRKASLPDRLHRLVAGDGYGFSVQLFEQVLPLLPGAAVDAWEKQIADDISALPRAKAVEDDWERSVKAGGLIRLRQLIADLRNDCDAFVALELGRGGQPDTLVIAERLLRAGRHAEALEWVRKPSRPRVRFVTWQDGAGLVDLSPAPGAEPVDLELRILDAMGRSKEAQDLRWATFLETLDTGMLREHVKRLADFEEFDVLDRAFAHAASAKDKYRALALFLAWPRLDLAARHVIGNRAHWDGRDYEMLAPAADALEPDQPLAATILYRALLGRILATARSKAYSHGARYLVSLDAMAGRIAGDDSIDSHATYRAGLLKKHGRKSGFWSLVKNGR